MRRLNIRITEEDYALLAELRETMGLAGVRTDSEALRHIIREAHHNYRDAIRMMRRLKSRGLAKPPKTRRR